MSDPLSLDIVETVLDSSYEKEKEAVLIEKLKKVENKYSESKDIGKQTSIEKKSTTNKEESKIMVTAPEKSAVIYLIGRDELNIQIEIDFLKTRDSPKKEMIVGSEESNNANPAKIIREFILPRYNQWRESNKKEDSTSMVDIMRNVRRYLLKLDL